MHLSQPISDFCIDKDYKKSNINNINVLMKNLFLLLSMVLVFKGTSHAQDENLILHLPLDGNFYDVSGNEFNCISNADFIEDRFGNPNSAVYFNGFDNYIDFPPNENRLKPQLPVSFSLWVRFDDLTPGNTTIFRTDFDQNNYAGFWMNVNQYGKITISYGDNSENTSPSNRRSLVGQTNVQTNTWYHLIGIIRDYNDMVLYLDCINENGVYEGSGGDLEYTDCQGCIGRGDGNMLAPPNYFKGAIDDFMFWSKDISLTGFEGLCSYYPNEINDNYSISPFESVTINPNPAGDELVISAIPVEGWTIDIYNLTGELVKKNITDSKIDVSDLLPGSYFIKILDSDSKLLHEVKFVKK